MSVRAMFLSAISMFSQDSSDKRGTVAARAEGCPEVLADAVSTHFQPQRKVVTLGKKNRSPPRMTSTDSRSLKRRVMTKPALLGSVLPPVTSSRERSRESGRGESFKRVTTVLEPGSEQEVRLKMPRSAQGAWKRSTPGLSTDLTLSRLPPK